MLLELLRHSSILFNLSIDNLDLNTFCSSLDQESSIVLLEPILEGIDTLLIAGVYAELVKFVCILEVKSL